MILKQPNMSDSMKTP